MISRIDTGLFDCTLSVPLVLEYEKIMGTLSVRIPDSYHVMIKKIAAKDKISINQFISSAIAEKISALETQDYLESRAANGSREKFLKVLAKVPKE